MNQPQDEIKVLNIDHLGIIAGIIDEMELVELVNQQVGIKSKEMLTPGQVMKAMILNGLGFLSPHSADIHTNLIVLKLDI